MTIFHGSLEIVEKPRIIKANRTLDYGIGFYATTSKSQAAMWVRRKLSWTTNPSGYTNIYEFDENAISILNVLKFERPDERWVDFVMKNRTDKKFFHSHDIVFGPVANDRVYAAFALYEEGLLDKQTLIKELRAYKLVDQILFHTRESLNYIKFIRAESVER